MQFDFGDQELRVTDHEGSTLRLELKNCGVDGLGDPAVAGGYETVTFTTESLSLPSVNVAVLDTSGRQVDTVTGNRGTKRHRTPVQLRVDGAVRARCWVETGDGEPVELLESSDGVRLVCETRLHVWLGCKRPTDRQTITVPPSISGVADALSRLHGMGERFDHHRASPFATTAPPRVEWGERTPPPDELRIDGRPDVLFRVPRRLDELALLMPLVHYTGGVVTITPESDPVAEFAGDEFQIGRRTGYDPGVVFRLLFRLDRLLAFEKASDEREGGTEYELIDAPSLEEFGLDAATLADDPGLRAKQYLRIGESLDDVLGRFPDWHLSVSINPTLENVRRVVPTLRDWPVIRIAEHDGVVVDNPMERPEEGHGGVVEKVKRASGEARTNGWLAQGVPTTGFKLFPEWPDAGDPIDVEDGESISVTVAHCSRKANGSYGTGAASEREAAAVRGGFERHPGDFDTTVRIVEEPTVDELASVVEDSPDLFYFAGHATDEDGIVCADGTLDGTVLDDTGLRVFFLNACETYSVGRELVQSGAAAGVVTGDIAATLDASPIGSDWALLMARGWATQTALDRVQSVYDSDDYFVVGDGREVVTQSDATLPPTVRVSDTDDDTYRVEITHDQPFDPGAIMNGTFDDDDQGRIPGTGAVYRLSTEQLSEWLDDHLDSPVFYDDDLYWPQQREWLDTPE